MILRSIFAPLLVILAAAGSIPQQINYQGYLTRPDGTPTGKDKCPPLDLD